MTEAEWLTCTDATAMLGFLARNVKPRKLRGEVNARKLRLFACAYCRCVWDQLDARSRVAVQVAERFADGRATNSDLSSARIEARNAIWVVQAATRDVPSTSTLGGNGATECALLRDLFPCFVRPVTIAPPLRTWNGGTVVKLAQGIYDERAFDRLPVLADALEDAGCENADILHHCRQPEPHVRGCWVVDLLLGKT
jgi:hypothetical protein